MAEVSVLDEDAIHSLPNFILPEFARQFFDMYDGQMEAVTLRKTPYMTPSTPFKKS